MEMPGISQRARNSLPALLLGLYDISAIITATLIAIVLRFEYLRFEFVTRHLHSAIFVLVTYLIIFSAFRLYRHRWPYAGVELLWAVLLANILGVMTSLFWHVYLDGERMPLSIIVMTCLLGTAFIGGQRLLLRIITSRLRHKREDTVESRWRSEPKRTLIMGGGQSAVEVLETLQKDLSGRYDIVGVLDDDTRHHGSYLRGYKILGGQETLHDLLRQNAVDEVIIALPNAQDDDLREYVLACCRRKVAVRVMPVIADLLGNPTAARGRLRVENITPDDLLQRASAVVDVQQIGHYLTGKRVMVTGAGGSIGSELCRQIARVNPALLVVVGHGENSIHAIELELQRRFPELAGCIIAVICDVRDTARVNYLMSHLRPQVVFHAAAHKHVPMMEHNTSEAVTNNVGGTRAVVQAATRNGVERFVLISTDKAVNPSSVMGATKFLCEEIVLAEAEAHNACCMVVRFGNVLGSRGSVLPLFQEQILRGGPVTITHPEMNRYFMTIPEAVSLTLQAGALGIPGSLFVLDMGRPVRITELAENLIRLSGLEPYRDIAIEFCGLRPGEKLTEELFTEHEQRGMAMQDRLFKVQRPQCLPKEKLPQIIDGLLAMAKQNDDRAMLARLQQIIPTFNVSPEQTAQRVDRTQNVG